MIVVDDQRVDVVVNNEYIGLQLYWFWNAIDKNANTQYCQNKQMKQRKRSTNADEQR